MFEDLTLEESLFYAATPRQWQAYHEVADAAPPMFFSYPDPMRGACDSYRERDWIEHEIWKNAVPKLLSGEWVAEGRWKDGPTYTKIDARLWSRLICNFLSFRFNRVWLGDGEECFVDVLVSQVQRARRESHVGKGELRRELNEWFVAHVEAGEPPRTRAAWLVAAEREFPELTPHLFGQVWTHLGSRHSLKFSGRPRE